jgi:NADH-quinone oxidoreductase subunit L
MWVPLAVLAVGAAFGGFLNAGALELFHIELMPLDHFLEPVFEKAHESIKVIDGAEHVLGTFLALALVAVAVGAGGAYYVYVQLKGEPARSFTEKFPAVHRFIYDKWRVDELYEETVIGAVDSLAEFGAWADKWIVDGILAKLSSFLVRGVGSLLRQLQTGRIQAYAAVMVVGLAAVGWFLVAPHASAKVIANHADGAYSVTATPGLGYSYRWDADGDGKPDSKDFGDKASVAFNLEPAKVRTVKLEVKNAFGQIAKQSFELSRPKPDKSGLAVEAGQAPPPTPRPVAPSQLPPGHPAIPQGK